MLKKICMRSLLGFPLGITIGYIITIITSLIWGHGYYSPCVPSLVEMVGSEILAVIIQTVFTGLLGVSFAASSVIWEIDNWSMSKQTFIYFMITALTMFPMAYLMGWMEPTFIEFILYFAVFTLIFIIIWFIQYIIYKKQVQNINEKIKKL
ncbi:DUF3021 domain-containing protein [Candidatus Stoquefichus massiliensis]|uniref:DUF3021 domain-containing protein n=1 Tax=Candidatus Stoquefichus massiliensis TaxID=1470350 RepID=UPI00048A17EA|nr:DUF3021 domain-containing protein [Candidatus Stoquefichus massiliensis]